MRVGYGLHSHPVPPVRPWPKVFSLPKASASPPPPSGPFSPDDPPIAKNDLVGRHDRGALVEGSVHARHGEHLI